MQTNAENKQIQEIVEQWLGKQSALIADPSGPSRAGLAKSLGQLGVKTSNLLRSSTFEDAALQLEKFKPKIVIADYEMGNRCGLDLLQLQRKNDPNSYKSLFVLVTGNTSQSAVAQAAEEEVDTFILKPYTLDVLKNSIIKAAVGKIQPSEYAKTIAEGKSFLEKEELNEAIKVFESALKLDKAPSLALAYHGQIQAMQKILDGAKTDYNKGLSFNKIHFKCLTGLFDTLYTQKRYTDAYDVVKKISRYFPANPDRLASVLHLAIITQSYEDVERYYQLFVNLDVRQDILVKYICAALVVCGKFYLKNNSPGRALELFEKAGITAAGKSNILKEIIWALTEVDMNKQASAFLERFPANTRKTPDFLGCQLLIDSKIAAAGATLDRGLKLARGGIEHSAIYYVIVLKSMELKKEEQAKEFYTRAIEKWPGEKTKFKQALASKAK